MENQVALHKDLLQQYVYVVAVNGGLMHEELARKIENYDLDAYREVLTHRATELESRSKDKDQFFDSSYFLSSAATVRQVISNLDVILRSSKDGEA